MENFIHLFHPFKAPIQLLEYLRQKPCPVKTTFYFCENLYLNDFNTLSPNNLPPDLYAVAVIYRVLICFIFNSIIFCYYLLFSEYLSISPTLFIHHSHLHCTVSFGITSFYQKRILCGDMLIQTLAIFF